MNLFRKRNVPTVVIASQKKEAFEMFPSNKYVVQEAITSSGLAKALEKDPALVVADKDTIVYTDFLPQDALDVALNTIRGNGIPVLTSSELIDFDATSIAQVKTKTGIRFAAPTVVAVTNYAGGVGKTTISLSTAKLMKETTGLGVAVVEAGSGASVLASKIGVSNLTSIYAMINNPEENRPHNWEGVDIYPMNQREAESLKGDENLKEMFEKIIASHTLTIFDVDPNNPIWPLILDLSHKIIIVSTPSNDAVDQSSHIFAELKELAIPEENILIFLNKSDKFYEKIGIGFVIKATIPTNVSAAQSYSYKIAGPVLHALYPAFYKVSGKKKRNKKVKSNGNGNGKVKNSIFKRGKSDEKSL